MSTWVEKSTGAGVSTSWTDSAQSVDGQYKILAYIYGTDNGGFVYTKDYGETWTHVDTDCNCHCCAVSGDGSKWIVGGKWYMVASSDFGATWTNVYSTVGYRTESFRNALIKSLSLNYDGSVCFHVSHSETGDANDDATWKNSGVYRSTNLGTSWTKYLSSYHADYNRGIQSSYGKTSAVSLDGLVALHAWDNEIRYTDQWSYLGYGYAFVNQSRIDINQMLKAVAISACGNIGYLGFIDRGTTKAQIRKSINLRTELVGGTPAWSSQNIEDITGTKSTQISHLSCSADGGVVMFGTSEGYPDYNNRLWISYNSGETWQELRPSGDTNRTFYTSTIGFSADYYLLPQYAPVTTGGYWELSSPAITPEKETKSFWSRPDNADIYPEQNFQLFPETTDEMTGLEKINNTLYLFKQNEIFRFNPQENVFDRISTDKGNTAELNLNNSLVISHKGRIYDSEGLHISNIIQPSLDVAVDNSDDTVTICDDIKEKGMLYVCSDNKLFVFNRSKESWFLETFTKDIELLAVLPTYQIQDDYPVAGLRQAPVFKYDGTKLCVACSDREDLTDEPIKVVYSMILDSFAGIDSQRIAKEQGYVPGQLPFIEKRYVALHVQGTPGAEIEVFYDVQDAVKKIAWTSLGTFTIDEKAQVKIPLSVDGLDLVGRYIAIKIEEESTDEFYLSGIAVTFKPFSRR